LSISPPIGARGTVAEALLEGDVQDDALARCLLQRAQGAFQKWPEAFVGFSATIRCREGDSEMSGDVCVFTGGRVEMRLPHRALEAWAEAALKAIAHARTPSFFKDGDGRFPISFEPEDDHPLGRRIRVHDGGDTWRTYRIDPKGRLRRQENAGPTRRTTVTYDGFVRTCPGRVIPTRTQILDWDAMTHTPRETEDIEDGYCCLDHVWLPARRRATFGTGVSTRLMVLELERHVIL
jgi:hypothetical protein